MKLILKENPDVELTVTVEYPERNSQVSRIIQKLKAEEQFLIGSESGRNYRVLMPEIFYIESVDKRTFVYTKDMVFRTEKRLYQLERELKQYDFVKVSRNCLVNINELVHIKTVSYHLDRCDLNILFVFCIQRGDETEFFNCIDSVSRYGDSLCYGVLVL